MYKRQVRAGDVVLSLANQPVSDVRSFEALYAKVDKAKPLTLLLRRGEWAQYVVIRPGPQR